MLSACSSIGEAQVHAGVEETVCMTYCNACMGCPLEAVVRNDNVVFTRAAEIPDTDRDIKRMCARGASIPVQLLSLIHIYVLTFMPEAANQLWWGIPGSLVLLGISFGLPILFMHDRDSKDPFEEREL